MTTTPAWFLAAARIIAGRQQVEVAGQREGAAALGPTLFTQMTPPPNEVGGISNAIFGSVVMVLLATFVGTPIGIMAGIYLAEYESRSWLAATTRFVNDILLSAPSIVIGLFVYAVVVARFKSFSGYAGVLALALIVIPAVMLLREGMRDGAVARDKVRKHFGFTGEEVTQ